MKMGVKEFRERFSEVAEGEEPVLVTKNGRIVGRYDPMVATSASKRDWSEIEKRLAAFRDGWKARTPDWRDRLRSIGLDDDGDPIGA
jgi:antitoxin (DNA-binding transcriptional repressor) of toxin-antitoxin stability system